MQGLITNPKAILFDWDNTLVGSWETIAHCLNHIFQLYDMPSWSLLEVKKRSRHSLRDNFPKLFGEKWQAARDDYYAEFKRIHLDRLSPLAGASALLEYLSEHNIPMGIISNKTHLNLCVEIDALGWDDHFKFAYGSGSTDADKPNPSPGLVVLKRLDMQPNHNIYYVGDTFLDVEFAYNLETSSIIIGDKTEAGFPPHQAHYFFETLKKFKAGISL